MKGDKNKLISINIDKIKEQKDIKLLLQLLRLQDEETYNHCVRVANIVYDIIIHMEDSSPWNEKEVKSILQGALIFDIGKAFLSFNLTSLSRELSDFEIEIMKTHPTLGYEIIHDVFDEIVEKIVLMHHEYENGKGYPFGLTQIPDYVKLIQYADTFDSLTSYHPYRNSYTYKEALAIIQDMVSESNLDYIYLEDMKRFVERNEVIIPKSRENIVN